MPATKTTVSTYLTPEQMDRLRTYAADREQSIAEAVRQALLSVIRSEASTRR